MRVEVQAVAPAQVQADVLAVPLTEEGLAEPAGAVDGALGGLLQELLQDGELRGDAGSTRLVHVEGKLPSRRVAAVGLGKRDRLDADAVRTAAAAVAQEAGDFSASIAWALDPSLPLPVDEQARAVVEGIVLGAYDPARWKHDG